jgi:hypothetical protein
MTDDLEDCDWQSAAYDQFLREDAPEDGVYEELENPRCPTTNDNQIQDHSQPNTTKRTSN